MEEDLQERGRKLSDVPVCGRPEQDQQKQVVCHHLPPKCCSICKSAKCLVRSKWPHTNLRHPVYEIRTHVTCVRLRPTSLPQSISPQPVTAVVELVVRNEVQLTPYNVSKIKFSIQNETKTYKMYEHLPHLTSRCAIAFCCYSSTVTSEDSCVAAIASG